MTTIIYHLKENNTIPFNGDVNQLKNMDFSKIISLENEKDKKKLTP